MSDWRPISRDKVLSDIRAALMAVNGPEFQRSAFAQAFDAAEYFIEISPPETDNG